MNAKTRPSIMVLAIAAVCSFAIGRVNATMTPAEAKAKQAYAIGVQAHLYGQPLMDLYRTFYEGTLDPKRGHDRTLNKRQRRPEASVRSRLMNIYKGKLYVSGSYVLLIGRCSPGPN
jgi:hypothetical protein